MDIGLFFFAFANAGVPFEKINPVTWIVLLSLIAGKTVGVSLFSTVATKAGVSAANRDAHEASRRRRTYRRVRPHRGPLCSWQGLLGTGVPGPSQDGCCAKWRRCVTRSRRWGRAQSQRRPWNESGEIVMVSGSRRPLVRRLSYVILLSLYSPRSSADRALASGARGGSSILPGGTTSWPSHTL